VEFRNLPKPSFAERDPATIEGNVLKIVQGLLGRKLARADPLRVFLDGVDALIIQQRELINYTGLQNTLAYASGRNLEQIGIMVGADRLPASSATVTLQLNLSKSRLTGTTIPKGTRVTAGDSVYFALDADAVIAAGETSVTASATCTVSGEIGNDYAIGEIDRIVDPVPFLDSIVNITRSEGGAGTELDDSYRERIREAPESFSVAGPEGAYEYWAKTASPAIADVEAMGPGDSEAPDKVKPGCVEIYVLCANGELPGEEILQDVYDIVNARDKRPLTDYVTVNQPEVIHYPLELTYYIDREDATAAASIQAKVEAAIADWAAWQKGKLGRDINPSKLIHDVKAAGAKRVEVASPSFQKIYKWQVAIDDTQSIKFGGLEDG